MIKDVVKNPQAVIGAVIICVILSVAIFAPYFVPNDPNLIDLTLKNADASIQYPLGCDALGRCELSRLIYGARYSIFISLPVLLILAIIGLLLGTFSVCAGSKADRFITAICDVFISFPSLIIAIAII